MSVAGKSHWKPESYKHTSGSTSLFLSSPPPLAATHSTKKTRRRATRVEQLERQIEKMFQRLRLAVIYGGDKRVEGAVISPSNNTRSWKSYETVARDIATSMIRLGCRDVCLLPEDMRLGETLKIQETHLAWLNTAGVQGNCSVVHAPAMLELFGLPYIGHDPMMAGILDNKHIFKRQMRALGIPTPDFIVTMPENGDYLPQKDPVFINVFGAQERPLIVKPVSGRASLHVTYVETHKELREAVEKVYRATKNFVLIEEYISGREFCIAVTGPTISRQGRLHHLPHPFTFSPLERVLERDEKIFTSMDQKPISGARAHLLHPIKERQLRAKLEEIALQVWGNLGVETLIRLDIRSDEAGRLFVLEANPKPDLKAPEGGVSSLVSIGLAEHGMSYDDLIFSIFADRVDTLLSERRGPCERLLRLA